VIDTRPPLLFNKDDALMWQSFLGIELETADDRFDPTQAQLMNFHSSQHMDVEFTYLLPITPRRALIEVTRFSTNSYQPEFLEDALLCEITHHTNGSPYSVLHRENGILPMGLRHAQPVLSDITYIKVGLHAGAARMSTGYAFQRIQRWAKNCALNLSKGDVPCRHELDPFMRRAMDYIFLQVIRVNTAAAPHLFMALFRNVPTERVIRFLSDRERFADYFFIIKSLPTFTFLLGIQKLLTRYFIHFLKGR
jgi:lycopene beta-cyclase